jgi:hypothetical protein
MPLYTDNDIDEDMKLTREDYIKILHHYHPGLREMYSRRMSLKTAKERAHRILAEKLCQCIKPPHSSSSSSESKEGRRIAYCTTSIFNRKGIRRHGFRCKTTRGVARPRLTGDVTKITRKLRLS